MNRLKLIIEVVDTVIRIAQMIKDELQKKETEDVQSKGGFGRLNESVFLQYVEMYCQTAMLEFFVQFLKNYLGYFRRF